jgi:trehalose-6-phosphatase
VPVQWKDMCKNMMQNYTERTTGSFIEDNKVASLTW